VLVINLKSKESLIFDSVQISSKNYTYKQIAGGLSLIISLFTGILIGVICKEWLSALIVVVLVFVFSYYVLAYVLNRYIQRKIKVIYKLISQEKASMMRAGSFDKTIDEVRVDVERWAVAKRGEIDRLQNNESFRKEFLMNLAHELRTPIFSIQGYIATLLDGEIDNPEVNVRFLESAARSTDRLSDLVDDLREITNYENKRIKLDKVDFSIQKLIGKVFEELTVEAKEKNISLGIKKGCEGDFMLWADKARIEQVLSNLIQNGIKYGREGGSVTVGIYLIGKRQVLIEITDNGMGMKPNQSIRVFERFFRTDEARAIDKNGNGLGLAIVKHIVEAHDHTITCRSEEGKGTTFTFTLDQDRN